MSRTSHFSILISNSHFRDVANIRCFVLFPEFPCLLHTFHFYKQHLSCSVLFQNEKGLNFTVKTKSTKQPLNNTTKQGQRSWCMESLRAAGSSTAPETLDDVGRQGWSSGNVDRLWNSGRALGVLLRLAVASWVPEGVERGWRWGSVARACPDEWSHALIVPGFAWGGSFLSMVTPLVFNTISFLISLIICS